MPVWVGSSEGLGGAATTSRTLGGRTPGPGALCCSLGCIGPDSGLDNGGNEFEGQRLAVRELQIALWPRVLGDLGKERWIFHWWEQAKMVLECAEVDDCAIVKERWHAIADALFALRHSGQDGGSAPPHPGVREFTHGSVPADVDRQPQPVKVGGALGGTLRPATAGRGPVAERVVIAGQLDHLGTWVESPTNRG